MRRMLVEADEDEENQINCSSFVESAVGVLDAMRNKQCFKDPERLREREAEELAKEFSVHAQSRDQLEAMLGSLCAEEDANNSGQVDRAQLRRVVLSMQASMQLERREVNALLISADEDNEGLLTYGDFVALAYDVLRQAILDILIDSTPRSAQLEQCLVELCQAEDPRNCGSLPAADLRLISRCCPPPTWLKVVTRIQLALRANFRSLISASRVLEASPHARAHTCPSGQTSLG